MKRKFLALGLILCLLLALSAPAWADVGSISGDSDYGGGSDWDSSSSWSNNDYYYSGSTSSDDGGGFGTMAALFVAIIIIGMIMSKKGGKGKNQQPVNAGGTFTTGLRLSGRLLLSRPAKARKTERHRTSLQCRCGQRRSRFGVRGLSLRKGCPLHRMVYQRGHARRRTSKGA